MRDADRREHAFGEFDIGARGVAAGDIGPTERRFFDIRDRDFHDALAGRRADILRRRYFSAAAFVAKEPEVVVTEPSTRIGECTRFNTHQ